MKNENAIINYPGSKRNLLNFIYENTYEYIDPNKYILDIFGGTGCVSNMYTTYGYKVISNDSEKYSYHIINSQICSNNDIDLKKFIEYYSINKNQLFNNFSNEIIMEENFLKKKENEKLEKLDLSLPKIWDFNNKSIKINDFNITSIDFLNNHINEIPFCLFTLYFSGYYFGLKQSIEIDSIRYAIEKTDNKNSKLFSCLFYAMKEAVFAKDGHMAQPLKHEKNFSKLYKVRNKSIFDLFMNKLTQTENLSIESIYRCNNKVINYNLDQLLQKDILKNNLGFIYADPPYTDLQYSRYYHLLNTVCEYKYPKMTLKNGKITTGLYTDNRYQSPLSSKKTALLEMNKLIEYSSNNKINLAISYAYPTDLQNEKSDRYTMNINDLIEAVKKKYQKVKVYKKDYKHANNRNSNKKSVYEYLIIGYFQKKVSLDYSILKKIETAKKDLKDIIPTNRNPIYNTMLYWSQKPYNVADYIIKNFSTTDDIILDPFMGSGVSIIESKSKRCIRKSIGIEINDLPITLSTTLLKEYNIKDTINNLKLFSTRINDFNKYYYTICPRCGKVAIIDKVIFDRDPNIQLKKIYYKCSCSFKLQEKIPNNRDIDNFIQTRNCKYIKDNILIENSRIAIKNGEKISDLFTNRNFFILGLLKNEIYKISDQNLKNLLNYTFISIIHKSKIVDKKYSSQWPMWIPKKDCVERNVISLMKKALVEIEKAIIYAKDNYILGNSVKSFSELNISNYLLYKKGVQNITNDEIPSNSINLVITDPPYLGQVAYSEYMQLYESFSNKKINYKDEIVISNATTRNKNEENYWKLMESSFKNISRIMKNNALMFMYFHDSNLEVWNKLINLLSKTDLYFLTSIHIAKKKRTLKNIIDPKKTMSGDSLLIFQKIDNNTWQVTDKSINDILKDIQTKLNSMLTNSLSGLSTSELYDNGILEFVIKNNYLDILAKKYKDFIDVFEMFLDWDSKNCVWKKR